jgi:diaminopimelate epimerase
MRFSKWHGLGNDYLLIERADLPRPLEPATVRRLCDYHRGIGSDGILEIASVDGPTADVVVWNPDGSTAELSGNGTRIAARWLAARSCEREVRVRVGDREVIARMLGGLTVETVIGAVVVGDPELLTLGSETIEVTPVSVGNPHAVVRRDPERSELLRLGPILESHPRFPGRTNVQLVRVDGPHELTVGVWERGAGETLASGTSSCAAAAAGIARGWCASPVTVHLAGGDLRVEIDDAWQAALTGPAQEICSGAISGELLAELGLDDRQASRRP